MGSWLIGGNDKVFVLLVIPQGMLLARVRHLMTATEEIGLIYVMTASVPTKEMPE